MGLVDVLRGKENIELKIVKQNNGVIEFYLEAIYSNGEESTAKELLYGPVVVDERGRPVVQEPINESKDYVSIAKNLVPDSSIDSSLVPMLLKSLKAKLAAFKKEGIQVQKVGNYTPEQLETLYS